MDQLPDGGLPIVQDVNLKRPQQEILKHSHVSNQLFEVGNIFNLGPLREQIPQRLLYKSAFQSLVLSFVFLFLYNLKITSIGKKRSVHIWAEVQGVWSTREPHILRRGKIGAQIVER